MPRFLLLGLMLAVAGCDKKVESPPAPAPPGPKMIQLHTCNVFVQAKKGPTFEGKASAADEASATAASMKAACMKMPEAERGACRDARRWRASITTATMTMGDKSEHTVTTRLERVRPQVDARGTSKESAEAACKAAVLEACKKAGASGDCVAAGTHDKKGASSSTEQRPEGK